MLGVDIMGSLTKTKRGNKYVLVFMDYLTKWPEAFALSEVNSQVVATKLVEEIISRHGFLRKLLSDLGSVFMSEFIRKFYDTLILRKLILLLIDLRLMD